MQGRSPIFSINSPRILRKKCIFRRKILVYVLHNATVASGECTSCRRRPKVLQCRFMQGRSPIFSMNSPRILRKKFIFRCNFPLFLLCRYHIFRTDTSPLSVVVSSLLGSHDVHPARLYRSVANVERSLRSRRLLEPILFCYMLSSID